METREEYLTSTEIEPHPTMTGIEWKCAHCGTVLGYHYRDANLIRRLRIVTDCGMVIVVTQADVWCPCGNSQAWNASDEAMRQLMEHRANLKRLAAELDSKQSGN